MCSQGIKRKGMAFPNQIQVGFAGLEENLNLPPFPYMRMISSGVRLMSVQIKAIQSFFLFLLRTQTIRAGIFCSLPTITSTERRYLLRPLRFLQMPKSFWRERSSPLNSYRILELFLIMAMESSPRDLIVMICEGLENQLSNST